MKAILSVIFLCLFSSQLFASESKPAGSSSCGTELQALDLSNYELAVAKRRELMKALTEKDPRFGELAHAPYETSDGIYGIEIRLPKKWKSLRRKIPKQYLGYPISVQIEDGVATLL